MEEFVEKLKAVCHAEGYQLSTVTGVPDTGAGLLLQLERLADEPERKMAPGPPQMKDSEAIMHARESLLRIARGNATIASAADRVAACDLLLRSAGK